MTKYDLHEFEQALRRKLVESDFEQVDVLVSLARRSLEEVVQEKLFTTKEAAAYVGCSLAAIQAKIKMKKIPAHKRGRDWFIKQGDLSLVKITGRGGRPRKEVKFNFYIPSSYQVPK